MLGWFERRWLAEPQLWVVSPLVRTSLFRTQGTCKWPVSRMGRPGDGDLFPKISILRPALLLRSVQMWSHPWAGATGFHAVQAEGGTTLLCLAMEAFSRATIDFYTHDGWQGSR